MSLVDVVTWAVFLLGGDLNPVDTEDVAVKAHDLAPGRFAWQKYPGQINLELVRVHLSDAKKVNNGRRLSGSGRQGWSLTRQGLEWVKSPEAAAISRGEAVAPSPALARSVQGSKRERERRRVMSLPAWSRWSKGDKTVDASEAREVFRLDSYSTATARELKLTRMCALFESTDEIGEFLEHLSRQLDILEGA